MFVCFSDSHEFMEHTKEDMKEIKGTNFNGENVIDCSKNVLALTECMYIMGLFDPNFLCNIINIFENTTYKQFKLWDMPKHDESY